MDRLEEIKARKGEIRAQVESAKTEEELNTLNEEVENLNSEETEIRAAIARKKIAKKLESDDSKIKEIEKEEDEDMKRKYNLSSPEYRSAWAKTLMGLPDERFTEEEKRALGDAVTTTATDFVQSQAEVQGINNGGLLVPTSVRTDLLELISKQSPIFNDIRKLQVAGNVDLPYLFSADDAEWYTEVTETKNEGQEYRNLQLTGWELAKDIVVSWKLEEMAVESFITFLLDELSNKMGKALINAVIYGDGNNKPTGVTNGLVSIDKGDDAIARVLEAYRALNEDARIGAKVYISTEANLNIISFKDVNGNYPYLQGIPSITGIKLEVDPYLKNEDIVAGNMRNYILNEVSAPRVDKEKTIKGRKVIYGAYGIYDGKPKPESFALNEKKN